MRSARLSDVRQMTSSRQSPRMSADSAGVDLVPLFDATPEPVSSRVSPPVPYLSMWVPSSSSRCGVAVPPDHEVGRARLAAGHLGAGGGAAQAGHGRRPRLRARVAGPDVGGDAAAVVAAAGRRAPEDLAGARVAHPVRRARWSTPTA